MGLFNGFLTHPSEVSLKQISLEYGSILIEGEYVEKAYKVSNDKIILTNKRLLLINKLGRGSKTEYITIPYSSIRKFSKEGKGAMDEDAELKIWLKDEALPIKKEFKSFSGANEIYQIIGKYTLG
ncbi:MAG: PH domain-containing protein [Sphingobacteriaceae bacterium]